MRRNVFVVLDFLQAAFCEDLSIMHYRNRRVELTHEGHIMLDDDNCHTVSVDRLDQISGSRRLFGAHACGRLIEKKKRWLHRQRHPNRKPLPLSMRQGAGRLLLCPSEMEAAQQMANPVRHLPSRCVMAKRYEKIVAHCRRFYRRLGSAP